MSVLLIDYRSKNDPFIPTENVLIGNANFFPEKTEDIKKTICGVKQLEYFSAIIIIAEDQTKANFLSSHMKKVWPEKTFTALSAASVLSMFPDITEQIETRNNFMKTFSCILPNLFLSSMEHSQNAELLNALNIKSIINIVPRLVPNKFEDVDQFSYLTIFADDTPDTELSAYFEICNKFIDKYIDRFGVLVHCAAGVSRSATVVIAYVMYKMKMSFQNAFSLVQNHHSICYPNFGFLCQLQEYERQLSL